MEYGNQKSLLITKKYKIKNAAIDQSVSNFGNSNK